MKKRFVLLSLGLLGGIGFVFASLMNWNATNIPMKNITDRINSGEFNALIQTTKGIYHDDGGTLGVFADDKFGFGVESPQTTLSISGAAKIGNTDTTCSSLIEGGMRFNKTSSQIEFCDGTTWRYFKLLSDCVPTSCSVSLGTCTNTGIISCVEGVPGECDAVIPEENIWTPPVSTICSGVSFTQIGNCGTERSATGSKYCCTANCAGKVCGDDGCGGSCGLCPGTCTAGSCVIPVPTDQLVGFYPFDGNTNDESGNNKNATLLGATLTTDRKGQSNKAYNLDGINNYIKTPIVESDLAGKHGRSFSIALWIRPERYSNTYNMVIASNRKTISDHATGFIFSIVGNGIASPLERGQFAFGIGGGCEVDSVFTTSKAIFNTWAHIVVTLDYNPTTNSSDLYIYRNGKKLSTKVYKARNCRSRLIGSGSTIENADILIRSANPIYIGNDPTLTAGYWFDGKMDEVAIYDRALTSAEVLDIYNYQVAN